MPKRLLVGVTDLQSKFPVVASEWHPTKNGHLKPSEVFPSHREKVWWLGQGCGHSWQATPVGRTSQGNACLVCAGYFVESGVNDLATFNPEVASEWHPNKNGDLKAHDVTLGTHKVVWWMCALKHEWRVSVVSRTSRGGTRCPVCQGVKVLKGFNDLESQAPKLMLEWDLSRNGALDPSTLKPRSNKKAWWECARGHSWQSTIAHRVNGSDCPKCYNSVSKAETEVFEFLVREFPNRDIKQTQRIFPNRNLSVDIVDYDYRICVEYNGLFWHSEGAGADKLRHQTRRMAVESLGYRLISIWEDEWKASKEEIESYLISAFRGEGKIETRDTLTVNLDKAYIPELESQGYEVIEELPPRIRCLDQGKYNVWDSGHAKLRKRTQ